MQRLLLAVTLSKSLVRLGAAVSTLSIAAPYYTAICGVRGMGRLDDSGYFVRMAAKELALAKTASNSSAGAIHRQFAKCYRDLARQIEGEQPLAPAPLSQQQSVTTVKADAVRPQWVESGRSN